MLFQNTAYPKSVEFVCPLEVLLISHRLAKINSFQGHPLPNSAFRFLGFSFCYCVLKLQHQPFTTSQKVIQHHCACSVVALCCFVFYRVGKCFVRACGGADSGGKRTYLLTAWSSTWWGAAEEAVGPGLVNHLTMSSLYSTNLEQKNTPFR